MKLPAWVGDRRYLVVSGRKVVSAFYVKERAEDYASKRGLDVKDRSGPG